MRFMTDASRQDVITLGFVLGMAVVLGVVPWTPVSAQTGKAGPSQKTERGRFVSYKDGTLTIQANSVALLGNKLPENAKTLVWDHDKGGYKPASTAEALNQAKAGTWFVIQVAKDNSTIRIGSRKGETIGTFVSFKNDRLLILGKNLGESYVLKYGNNVHFNKFRDDVPIYESVDSGDYQRAAGALRTILANLKEGTVVTVPGEGDDNITRIDIGVAKK
ncbi:MAG: hypothetical protein EXS16_08465 [Gemmataceae bacterium]|nr:hypothetical protein [Gemmataceae bacterium]